MFNMLFPKHWSTLKKLIWLKAAALSSAVQKIVSGAIVHIKDALAGPAQNVTIAIAPVQSGSGDPSPDNVRPISGWTGCNIYHTGKNLFPATLPDDRIAGQISSNGTIISATYARVFAIPCKQNTYFYFSQETTGTGLTVAFSDKLPVVGDSIAYQGNMTNRTEWELNSGSHTYLLLAIANENQWQYFATHKLQIEIGESKTDYEAPKDITTIPITFPTPPGTVYGGTLDVTNGVLTVTHKSVDMGDLSWSAASTRFFSSGLASVVSIPANNDTTADLTCEVYKASNYSAVYADTADGIISVVSTPAGSAGQISLRDRGASGKTGAEFRTYVSGKALVYPLAMPQTYQLTPQEVTMLLSNNTIWADTGDTTLTYMADGRASDIEALGILLAGRYVNHGAADEATDAEALNILLGR